MHVIALRHHMKRCYKAGMKRKNATNFGKGNKRTGDGASAPERRVSSAAASLNVTSSRKGLGNCGPSDQRMDAAAMITTSSTTRAATSSPQAAPPQNWARYIDSRLKQFSLR